MQNRRGEVWPEAACPLCEAWESGRNLYSMTSNQRAILELTGATQDRAGSLPPLLAIYPDSMAPVVR